MVWHSPTYSNDDILSTTIHQEPTVHYLLYSGTPITFALDVTYITVCAILYTLLNQLNGGGGPQVH